MMRLPKAILFDLDDTILSFGGRELLLTQVAEEFAAELAPLTPAEVGAAAEAAFLEFWNAPGRYAEWRNRVLEARTMLVERLFESSSSRAVGATPDAARRFAARFHEVRESGEGRLFPGAVETLEALRAKGIRLALVTNGHADTQRKKVEHLQLAPLFHHVQIEGEVGFGKPEERAYRHAMAALEVEPHETWMVGDHLEWEVAAPQRLGIFAVWHDHVGKGLPEGSTVVPDLTVRLIRELLDIL
jgi:putative hydrolase of the HAD superfamily